MSNNIIRRGSFEIEAAEAALAEASKGGADFFKPKSGQNALRFLPPPEGKTSPFVVSYQHWVTLPDGSRSNMNCGRMVAKQRCPVCEKMDDLLRSGNEVDFKAASEFKPKLRVFANIIDRDDEAKGVQVFGFGKSVLDQLVAIRKDTRAGGDFTDIEDGFDIILTKKGEGMKTEYTCLASRESSALSDDADLSSLWMDNQYDLDVYKRVLPYEEAYAKLTGESVASERPGRVTSGGLKKPEVLPPANKTAKRRNVEDDINY